MPVWIGDRLILASPLDPEYLRRDPRAVVLDAGQVFGTGTHPTTHMCLLELQAHLVERERVLDVGTGSGILAIAAAKLGAGKVVAIDRSVAACRVARANVSRNGFHGTVSVVAGTPVALAPTTRFGLVLANLDTAVDAKYWLPTISQLCRIGGKAMLSGFQAPGEGVLQAALGEVNLTQLARRTQGGWIMLVLERHA